MTASELTIYDLPVKPAHDTSRTPALIGREIDLIKRRTKESITVASIAIGYRLIEAKRLEGHGGWLPWLAARDINERTARRTMELAGHHEYLSEHQPEKLPAFMGKSLRQALAIVHEAREAARKPRPRARGKGNGERQEEEQPEVEILPPDPVHVLHHLAQQWPAGAIRQHQLTTEQADLLEEDLPALLPALIELAERHDVSTGIAVAAPPAAPESQNLLPPAWIWSKAEPLIRELEEQGRKNVATMSPGTVAHLAHQLRLLLDPDYPAEVRARVDRKRGRVGSAKDDGEPEAEDEPAPEPAAAPWDPALSRGAAFSERVAREGLLIDDEPEAAPGAPEENPEAFRREVADRLHVDRERPESSLLVEVNYAKAIGIDTPTLRRAMAALPIDDDAMAKIEAFLAQGEGAAADRQAFRRRVEDAMGDATQKSFADRCEISVPTLRKVLAAAPVRPSIREQIETCLAGAR